MSLLRQGFREIGRKFRRAALTRRIKAAGRVRAGALRALGQRAIEAGATDPASADLLARLAATAAKDQQLTSRLGSLDEGAKQVEQQRDADAARSMAREQEVMARKRPLDAQLAAQPSSPAEAVAAAAPEIARLKAAIAPLEADLERIRAERKQASDTAKRALGELRREMQQARTQAAGVSRERDLHLEELGTVLTAAGLASPALATEQGAVTSAQQALASLQGQHQSSLAESRALPAGTMLKFGGLMAAALLALGGAAYAATKAAQVMSPARTAQQDCGMPSDEDYPPVKANAGGPYRPLRGKSVTLDGSKSKGRCLTYTWTFDAVNPPEKVPPSQFKNGTGIHEEDAVSVEAAERVVNENSCPPGTKGNDNAQKNGAQAPTYFLCSLKVTLTVVDGRGEKDSQDVVVKVKARGPKGWQTKVEKKQEVKLEVGGSHLKRPASGEVPKLELGKNVCALDDSPAHALHAGRSWEGDGYSVKSIEDPQGPFDQWWFIDATTLRIQRVAQLNQDLDKKSGLYKLNLAKGFPDIAVLRESVIEHERLHGTLLFEKWQRVQGQKRDPATAIEALSNATSMDTVVTAADMAFGQIESHLHPPHNSDKYIKLHEEIKRRLRQQLRFNRTGNVWLPDSGGAYDAYPIHFANAGEDGG
jgi:hypothetical protein